MPRYIFVAKTKEGETQKGILEAPDEYFLARKLKEEGLILIKATKFEAKSQKRILSLFLGKISLSEKIFFTRNLQIMLAGGVPLAKALESLKSQTKNKEFQNIIEEVKVEITKGSSLSQAISKFPQLFSDFYQSIIKVGEETGRLEEVLKDIVFHMEREYELRAKIRGAMIYPAVIILFMIAIGSLMLVMVVPRLQTFLKELEIEIPWTTKLFILMSNFLIKNANFILFSLVILIFFFRLLLKISEIKKEIDKFLLKIPFISNFVQTSNLTFFARNLSLLLKGGVSLPLALEISSKVVGNLQWRQAILEAREKIQKGVNLSEALNSSIFPSTLIEMVKVGEETGETAKVLEKLAQFYEDEMGRALKNLISLIEPLLMIIIGIVVGFFAIAMFQPMYTMIQGIK